MTDKNADVEWLRELVRDCDAVNVHESAILKLSPGTARRLLAHIDKLERYIEAFKREALQRDLCNEPEHGRRPTIHEIAPKIMAVMIHDSTFATRESLSVYAEISYNAAEALVAEGRKR